MLAKHFGISLDDILKSKDYVELGTKTNHHCSLIRMCIRICLKDTLVF